MIPSLQENVIQSKLVSIPAIRMAAVHYDNLAPFKNYSWDYAVVTAVNAGRWETVGDGVVAYLRSRGYLPAAPP